MATCPNCGARQPDEAAFCDVCGAALRAGTPPPQTPPYEQHSPTLIAAHCPVCGATVSPDASFCEQCGAPLKGQKPPRPPEPPPGAGVTVCPSCGARLEPGSRFCDQCGAPVEPSASPPSVPKPEPPPSFTPPPAPPPSRPVVEVITGRLMVQATGVALPLPPGKKEILIGRKDPISGIFPDVDLTDHGGDRGGVSRRHARIFIQDGAVVIEDLNSKNHTYVNGRRLTPGLPHPLDDGDEVRMGRVKLNYYAR